MKIFLDSINTEEINKYNNLGIIDGITTNPSLMSSTQSNFHDTVSDICALVVGDVSIEVSSNDFDSMIQEGEKISKIATNIVIKLPMSWDGIRACKYFTEKGSKVNMTLCFSANQALFAAKAGATYISPFVGRLDDIGQNGINLISTIRKIYDNYKFKTQILAASIRTEEHVSDVALAGADVATIPSKLISKLVDHHLTDSGIEKFNQDWKKSGLQI